MFQLLHFVQSRLGYLHLPCQYLVDFGDDCPETSLRRSSGEAEEKNEEELQVSKVFAFAASSSSLLSPSLTFSLVSCSSRALLPSSLGVSLPFVVAFTDSLVTFEVVRLTKAPALSSDVLMAAVVRLLPFTPKPLVPKLVVTVF